MSDKVFTKKMTLSICLILLCLCALSISAGAFFSDTTSLNKTYSTAAYDLTITATKQVTTLADPAAEPLVEQTTVVPDAPVFPDPSEPHKYTLTVLPDTKAEAEGSLSDREAGYSVNIAIDSDATTATTSGYCKIVIRDPADPDNIILGCYYTGQIARGTYEAASVIQNKRDIKIVTEKEVLVTFIPLWGTYSGVNGDALADNATIAISSDGLITLNPVTDVGDGE